MSAGPRDGGAGPRPARRVALAVVLLALVALPGPVSAGSRPAAVTPPAGPEAAPVPGQVVVDQTFDGRGLPPGWRTDGGRWWIAGGRLHGVASPSAGPARVLFGRSLPDFRLEATVRLTGPAAGWAALGLDVPAGPGARGGVAAALLDGPAEDTLAFTEPEALGTGEPAGAVRVPSRGTGRDVRVTVEVHGERARWLADGRRLARSLTLPRQGGVTGLFAGAAEVTFDDVRITALAPEPLRRGPGAPMAVMAHRGAPTAAPENTLASDEAARAAGAEWIENDVQPSADGVPHVIHDPTLDRTTDGTGPVRSLTAAQLAALDAGSWFSPAFAGQRVPTLAAQLEDLRSRGGRMLLELKGPHDRNEVARVLDIVRATGMTGRIVVQSFDAASLAHVREMAPEVPLALLRERPDDDPAAVARALGLASYNVSDRVLRERPGLVRELHAAGVAVMVWTVDDPARWAELDAAGVDAVITDDPAGLVRFNAGREPAAAA